MTDEITARIEAPRRNAALIGHAAGEADLLRAWRADRLAHGWLITGPPGVGKATLAWRFARFVLAGGGTDDMAIDPDDPVFRQLAAGANPDCRLVRRSYAGQQANARLRDEIAVDDVRALGPFLRLKPAAGGWRVVVVDAADQMNRNAQNALLKLLEEPPSRTVMLLVCDAPSRLLATVRSRCRRLALQPLAAGQVSAVMSMIRPDLSAADAGRLAALADGSPGRALRLADVGGLELHDEMAALVDSLPTLDVRRLHATADRLARPANADQYATFTALLRRWLAGLIHQAAGAPAVGRDLDRWLEVWEKTARLFVVADGVRLDRKQVILNTFFNLAEAARG